MLTHEREAQIRYNEQQLAQLGSAGRSDTSLLLAEIDRLRTEKNTLGLRLESAAIAYPYTPEGREHIAIQLQGSQIDELSQQVDRLRALNDSLSTDLVNREAKLGIAIEALASIAHPDVPFPLIQNRGALSDSYQEAACKALIKIRGQR